MSEFKAVGYENNDIRKQTDDLINNLGGGGGSGATAEKQDEQTDVLNQIVANLTDDEVTAGQNLAGIVTNTAQTKDRLQDGEGIPAGTILRQLVDETTYTNQILVDSVDGIGTADLLVQLINLVKDNLSPKNSLCGTEIFEASTFADAHGQLATWMVNNGTKKVVHTATGYDAINNVCTIFIIFINI